MAKMQASNGIEYIKIFEKYAQKSSFGEPIPLLNAVSLCNELKIGFT